MKPWSEMDEAWLADLVRAGKSNATIAATMNRSEIAVKSRRSKLRLGKNRRFTKTQIDTVVDRTVKQIERVEPQAERLHRLLSMVMDRAPDVNQLVVLGENQLEQAERWATAQAAAMRQVAKGKKDVIWPDKPSFL